jgi:hypothetical protein
MKNEISVARERVEFLRFPRIYAATMLNYHWEQQIGSVEKGKFAEVSSYATIN